MTITRENLEWTSEDVDNWASFLRSQTGQRLIPKLAESAPSLLASGDTNAILVRNGQLLGFQGAVQALLDLSAVVESVPTAPAHGEYPPLDADEYWVKEK